MFKWSLQSFMANKSINLHTAYLQYEIKWNLVKNATVDLEIGGKGVRSYSSIYNTFTKPNILEYRLEIGRG